MTTDGSQIGEKSSWDIVHSPHLLGPSTNGLGWGVFAERDYLKGDIVEIAPLFVRLGLEEDAIPVAKQTMLDDYHYEFPFYNDILGKSEIYSMLSFGRTLYYNHSSQQTNIKQKQVGAEPTIEDPDGLVAIVYIALCDIKKGEELLVDYGGSEWFSQRGITEIKSGEKKNTTEDPSFFLEAKCRVYGGWDESSFLRLVDVMRKVEMIERDKDIHRAPLSQAISVEEGRMPILPPQFAGLGRVRALEKIPVGGTIDYEPVILLPKNFVQETILESVVVLWQDLSTHGDISSAANGKPLNDADFRLGVSVLLETDAENSTSENSTAIQKKSMQILETVLLPLAGSICLMKRNPALSNASVKVENDPCNPGAFCVRIVATEVIERGVTVVIDLPEPKGIEKLVEEIMLSGQPLYDGIEPQQRKTSP